MLAKQFACGTRSGLSCHRYDDKIKFRKLTSAHEYTLWTACTQESIQFIFTWGDDDGFDHMPESWIHPDVVMNHALPVCCAPLLDDELVSGYQYPWSMLKACEEYDPSQYSGTFIQYSSCTIQPSRSMAASSFWLTSYRRSRSVGPKVRHWLYRR